MKLSLIGMSNSGKTFWSKKLEEKGFRRFSSDDYIEEELGPELKKLGYSGIHGVSAWLGQPYEKRYSKNSKIYLNFEIESLKFFISLIEKSQENAVIDTTGSLIYTGESILNRLKQTTKIIYFDTPLSIKEEMIRSYIQHPKPVLWVDAFSQKEGEKAISALARCYPDLLEYRTTAYKKLADTTLDYFQVRKGFSIKEFLDKIK